MPVDITALIDDLAAETAALRAIIDPLPAAAWQQDTPASGWTVSDQVSHLAHFDEAAITAATDPEAFTADLARRLAAGSLEPDAIAPQYRDLGPAALRDWFARARARLLSVFAGLDPAQRMPWYGPPMSVASALTARLMETWAHGQDIADAVGVIREPTSRLRHVAHIGVGARTYSFAANGLPPPPAPVRVELTGPAGEAWTWGPADATDLVTGPALDFCLLVTRRRHWNDTAVEATGPGARQWLVIAQAFAGPPGTGRAPGQFASGGTAHGWERGPVRYTRSGHPQSGEPVTTMRAAYAAAIDLEHPLSGLTVGTIGEPGPPAEGWVRVEVRASSLNHHDLWSLRGVGLAPSQLPMVLGCDAAGIGPDGAEVIVHAVIGNPAAGRDETYDPKRTLLSERYPGTFADAVWVPARNLVPKPAALSFVEAACLPTAWLTAYKMLAYKGEVKEGNAVLVQGAGGGVATAAVVLAKAFGARVYATSRSAAKRERVAALGATAVEPGARLPERVDLVMETVGAPTMDHSLKSTAPGGKILSCGATGGYQAEIDLRRLFFLQLELIGATMGSRDQLAEVAELMAGRGITPVIDSVYAFDRAADAFARLESGEAFGKIVLDHTSNR